MNLVVVESPAKAKTIEKYLGKGYKVIASKGHVVDLPKSEIGVDTEKGFKPKYVITKSKALTDIKKAFEGKDTLILAVDSDREGEAIGWHIAKQLKLIDNKGKSKPNTKKMFRIVFTEITKDAINDALKNPRAIDMNLVDAQQARRILDRIVGYKLSPLLWKKIRYGLSAGRVQSVALKLIVDREEERNKFNAVEFWGIEIVTSDKKNSKAPEVIKILKGDENIIESDSKNLSFELIKYKGKKLEITNEKEADEIISKISHKELEISNKTSKSLSRYPKPPFTTSTLQQAASAKLGMSAKETMRIAQKLYEAGFITYMRTDSLNISLAFLEKIRKYIGDKIGKDYLPEKIKMYATKTKLAQEAHEAIRPTHVKNTGSDLNLSGKEKELYDLIWKRTVASQMKEAILENSSLFFELNDYLFQATGQRILFPGFLKVYGLNISEVNLPDLKIGDKLYSEKIFALQKFTQPPPRYSEATLIKALELYGIGRPSTYASIISTILARKYVEKAAKYLFPTDIGCVVTKLLVKYFHNIVDTDFTSSIENQLDDIAEGKNTFLKVLTDFYKPFENQLTESEKTIKKDDFTIISKSDKKCPECKKPMNVKLSRYGKFLSCSNFPDCKGMLSIDGKTDSEIAKEAETDDFKRIYKPAPLTDDNKKFLFKRGRFGNFWAHPDYPKVKGAKPLELNDEIFKQVYGKTPKAKDGSKMVLRRGRFGEFWGHSNYPEVKEFAKVDKKKVKEKKLELGIQL